MKKISYILMSLILLINVFACTGYKPIFSSTNLDFKIADYSVTGDKKLGNQIYNRLYNLSKSSQNTHNTKNIYVLINIIKDKKATSKNSAGKILAYRISLSTTVTVRNFIMDNQIFSEIFVFSSSYKVQDQYSETKKIEDRSVENLIDKTYQDLLIKLSESILLE